MSTPETVPDRAVPPALPEPDAGQQRTRRRPGVRRDRNVPRRRGERSRLASVALHATLLAATVIAVGPVAWILVTSFKPGPVIRSGDLSLVEQPTLHNYSYLLTETDFPRWFANSLLVAALTMAFGITMSASAGYALSRFRFPGRRTLLWSFLVTQMFPVAVLIVPMYVIMSNLGLINTPASLVIAYVSVAVPFCTWMLKGYFDTIPTEIDEAGRVDGLSPWGVFWRLALPLARPGLAVTAFYTFLTAWGEVAYASAFINQDDRYTLGFGLQTFVTQFNSRWEYLTAAAVLITIPAAIVFFFAQRHLVAGLTAGGTKG